MHYNLLETVQSILSSMDSEEVESITDTVESMQVVECIKTVYNDLMTRGDLGINKLLFNLDETVINTRTMMTKPSNIQTVDWIKYNCADVDDTDAVWREMVFLPPVDFVNMMHSLNPSEDNVTAYTITNADGFSIIVNIYTDRPPSYYTSFDDTNIVFDSIDLETGDEFLQTEKTLCYGNRMVEFEALNTFTFDLQPHQYALLLNEAKSLAWAELKQTANAKAEQAARRNWIHVSKHRDSTPTGKIGKAHPFNKLPNFGRK